MQLEALMAASESELLISMILLEMHGPQPQIWRPEGQPSGLQYSMTVSMLLEVLMEVLDLIQLKF